MADRDFKPGEIVRVVARLSSIGVPLGDTVEIVSVDGAGGSNGTLYTVRHGGIEWGAFQSDLEATGTASFERFLVEDLSRDPKLAAEYLKAAASECDPALFQLALDDVIAAFVLRLEQSEAGLGIGLCDLVDEWRAVLKVDSEGAGGN